MISTTNFLCSGGHSGGWTAGLGGFEFLDAHFGRRLHNQIPMAWKALMRTLACVLVFAYIVLGMCLDVCVCYL
jgi:hypothetical protein